MGAHEARSRPPEPGYYLDGEFGIRIEDVALVVEAQTEVGRRAWGARAGTAWGPASSEGWGRGHPMTPFCGSTRLERSLF